RILGGNVTTAEVTHDTAAAVRDRGQHPEADWIGMDFCMKSTPGFPPGSKVHWRVDTYTNPAPAKARIAANLGLPLGTFSPIGGVGDEAIADQPEGYPAEASSSINFRQGDRHVILVAVGNPERFRTTQLLELAKLIASRLD
ncbi:MAG TPA: hypothetical protein VIL36_01870, partial [Acidimicrobiales bacterium]